MTETLCFVSVITLKFNGEDSDLFDLDWFKFTKSDKYNQCEKSIFVSNINRFFKFPLESLARFAQIFKPDL